MAKILFINLLGNGHFNPTIGLVKELMSRGEQVTYTAGEEFRDKIEKTGARFKSHTSLSSSINGHSKSDSKNSKSPMEELKEMMEEITDYVFNSKEKFDYIFYDSAFIIGSEVGRILKIPTICSITTFATNEKANIFSEVFKQYGTIIQQLVNSPVYINLAKNLKEKYDIKIPSITTAVTGTGTINVVYTSKHFQLCGESFDESYKFIGPSISDRKDELDFSLETNDKKKVIYISLGTLFNASIEFYENCFKAFGNMDVTVIMSIGKDTDINIFSAIPSNFIVRNYVSQLEVLKHTDVFITHGGMNSTNEALYYDVPLILIPQSVDQPAVANRVAELGAGIVIEKDKITPETLNQSVVKILSDNTFRINSEKLGRSLREAGGYKKAVDEILKLK
ncbi:macrolide family glycosyltransferase [Clostridium estertheticum]|uniref:macrolide family glycosyltransferase n=1 Tax=Clostridium estertheticum TaxID=238834 RepID=UPI001C7D5ECD|nr:macrolide family glycosyltransferase [Clostridium estertheticum]MBX4266649.1 glycosyl transferase [Clostridium estertheticum]WLC88224.1 glycosyl transferase [Clostridium estertheticum]